MSELLRFTNKGIYCEQADVYIDPWKRVDKALITHGHSDHARGGMGRYLCTHLTKPILNLRIGKNIKVDAVDYGERILINGVTFSFHPAGHVIGSAQIRVEYQGEVWVASGDYKLQSDGISDDFEVVQCHTYITESTFGLPVYQWPEQKQVVDDINQWWQANAHDGKTSIITSYSLGKAQRVLHNVDHAIGPVYCHGSVEKTNEAFRNAGVPLFKTREWNERSRSEDLKTALIITPGSVLNSNLMSTVSDCSIAAASGWMAVKATQRWQAVQKGFVMSDHADWNGLNSAIEATGASRVIVTHGYTDVFSKWLTHKGIEAYTEKTMFEGENEASE